MGKLTEWSEKLQSSRVDDNFTDALKNVSNDDWKEIEEFILKCIKLGTEDAMKFAIAIIEKRNIIKWKEHPESLTKILEEVLKYGKIPQSEHHDGEYSEFAYDKFMDKFVPLLKSCQVFKKQVGTFFEMLMATLASEKNRLHIFLTTYSEDIPWTKNPEWAFSVFDRVYEIANAYPEMKANEDLARSADHSILEIFRECNNNTKPAVKYAEKVGKIFNLCKDQEWIDPDDSEKRTLNYSLLVTIMEDYLCRFNERKEIIAPMVQGCKELWECDEPILQRDANNVMTLVPGNVIAALDKDVALELLDRFLDGTDTVSLLSHLEPMFKETPEIFYDKLEAIAENMEGAESYIATTTISFFLTVVKHCPEKITPKTLKCIVDTLEMEETAGIGLMALVPLAEKYPEMFIQHEDAIIKSLYTFKMMSSQSALVLVHMSRGSKERADKYLAEVAKLSKECDTNSNMGLLYSMTQFGVEFPESLGRYEDFFTNYLEDTALRTYAERALDVIHQRSLAAVADDVQEVQENVDNLDERVTNTEENVENLNQEVTATQAGMAILSEDVEEQAERLDELEEVVEETVDKVEEIDKKTLSHAPKWSQDVSRIMNEKTEHDWRLLSSRLGYSNDDIRNWATQANPCLSMFDEWFATHKTREATHAILKHLEEINRLDAAMIVENALKQTEDVVEDEEQDYQAPPDVFISYQWGVQDEVKLLKRHLEFAGYESWMDIGQMGGGDKLFEKIDTGIRAAKVILCCVTEKYAKSPNCNREVNLSVNLGKPIIPLLMEKISWPPAGSMGPIFGEYLFIRFFARGGERSGDNRFWPLPKFQELLMQLRYIIPPNDSLIKEPYTEWQSPPEEIIVIKPKDKGNNTVAVQNESNEKTELISPDVFISYQWGKQPQIKVLYKKLTSMGYTCWLDIMQMGGGDSLYDKIDKGVRGCKVVVSCVTTKYSLSANCRREVSLADALKKPIVPLLLEKITWPPEGPMSMVFSQLLYINFCKPDVTIQDKWECPQMTELIGKIDLHLPHINNTSEGDSGNSIGEVKEENTQPKQGNNNTPKADPQESDTASNKTNERQTEDTNAKESKGKQENKKSSSCSIL